MKKTRIFAVADLHGDSRLAKKLALKAKKEKVDLIILAGDLTLAETSFKNIVGYFSAIKKPVLIVHGNHESNSLIDFLEQKYTGAKNLHGSSFKHKNIGFFGVGGADIGLDVLEDSDLFKILSRAHRKIKDSPKKIMVTHMHPRGSKSEFSGFKGSKAISKAIYKFNPDFLITAHIHEAGGIEEKINNTKVINVSRKEKIFEI
jgi:Icc-related predicted phosphoesterase